MKKGHRKRKMWTQQEDRILLTLKRRNIRWTDISRKLDDRTDEEEDEEEEEEEKKGKKGRKWRKWRREENEEEKKDDDDDDDDSDEFQFALL